VSISGKEAVEILERLRDRVELRKKDNTDKFWNYKLRSGKRTEFAFDPSTKNGLYIRVDREPPLMPGVTDVERIRGKDISTALERVFSGGYIRQITKPLSLPSRRSWRSLLTTSRTSIA
jgi:hypothetical protein